MQTPLVLMTTHGTVVCRDGADGLYHVPLDTIGRGDTPLMVDLFGMTRAGRHDKTALGATTPANLGALPGLPNGCELLLSADRRTAAIRRDERFFSAEPMNRAIPCDRVSVADWESFAFLTEEDYATLRHITTQSWVTSSRPGVAHAHQIGFAEGFVLSIGQLRIDLRYNLPFVPHVLAEDGDATRAPSYSVLIDGWRLERLYLFRPLIVMTAFGSATLVSQVASTINSLLEFGGYDGEFHLITDLDEAELLQHLPALAPTRLTVQKLTHKGGASFGRGKYSVIDHPGAKNFQPVLLLDPTSVCDGPIEPLLAAVAAQDRISTTPARSVPPAQGNAAARLAGFGRHKLAAHDEGLLGIPNLRRHAELLELARAILTNLSETPAEDQHAPLDQEVLDYIAYATGGFDTHVLDGFVSHAGDADAPDVTRRLGLMRFSAEGQGRPAGQRMQEYVDALRALPRP